MRCSARQIIAWLPRFNFLLASLSTSDMYYYRGRTPTVTVLLLLLPDYYYTTTIAFTSARFLYQY